jgi:hypothetical protein
MTLDQFWIWPGWTAVSSVATIAAAVVVLKYTHETIRLRRIAKDQLEASMAPLLVLSIEKPRPEEDATFFDPVHEGDAISFTIRNYGKGAALRTALHGAVLPPIPAGQTLHCRMDVRKVYGGASKTADGHWPTVEHEILYRSTSGRTYRTKCRSHKNKVSAESLEYLRLDE